MIAVFEDDWKASADKNAKPIEIAVPASPTRDVKAIMKTAVKKLPLAPVVKQMVEVIHQATDEDVDGDAVKETVEAAVKSAFKKAVKKAAAEVVPGDVA